MTESLYSEISMPDTGGGISAVTRLVATIKNARAVRDDKIPAETLFDSISTI